MLKKINPHTATILVFIGAGLISFSSIMVKLTQVAPTVTACYRLLFGGLSLLILAIIKRKSLWVGKKPFFLVLFLGLFFCCDLGFWHTSIHYIGPGVATLLTNMQVFMVAFAGIFLFKEVFNLRLGISIPLALMGLYMIIGMDNKIDGPNYRLGVFLSCISALSYSLYIILLRITTIMGKRLPTESNMAMMSLTSALLLGIAAYGLGESFAIPRPIDWLWLLIYGLICHALGWMLIATGMPMVPASRTGLILLLQPTLAFVWDVLIFERPTTSLEVLGAVITLGAIYLGSSANRTKST